MNFLTDDGHRRLVADRFGEDIDTFFQLRISGFKSPRSTAVTGSFEFRSFDEVGNLLDEQTRGIVAQATIYHEIQLVSFESTSQRVGAQDVMLQVSFTTLDELRTTDKIRINLPKWNEEARFAQPMIVTSQDDLVCQGVTNSQETINCFIFSDSAGNEVMILQDVLSLQLDLNKGLTAEEIQILLNTMTGEELQKLEAEVAQVNSDRLPAGTEISFKIGPIKNPISTAEKAGFELTTLSHDMGIIAEGSGSLTVTLPALVASDSDTVQLAVTETYINQPNSYILSVDLPVPVNSGCIVDLTIPKPLVIGPELKEILIGGLFGPQRVATISIQASQNLIRITGACQSYRQNAVAAYFEIHSLVNPGYVTESESFMIEISDRDENLILRTLGGMTYTTTPGTITVDKWYASNLLVSAPSEITFSVQPTNPTDTADVQVKIYFPREDFEELPSFCELVFYNQLVDPDNFVCVHKKQENALVLSRVLYEPYKREESQNIEFSIDNIKLPSSSRPTGAYHIEFLTNVQGTYRLVDEVTVYDKLRALPGALASVKVTPEANTTYTVDTMKFEITPSHAILKGGFIEIGIPPQLSFYEDLGMPRCINFNDAWNGQAVCDFKPGLNRLYIRGGFSRAEYGTLDRALEFYVQGIFTLRQVQPTNTFNFVTYDDGGYEIDTHKTFFLGPMRNAKEIEIDSVVQADVEVGELSTYDILIKSPYPVYPGDVLVLTVPAQTASNLAQTYRDVTGSALQSNLREDLHAILLGVQSSAITVDLEAGKNEIPIGEVFGVQLSYLENPETTKPSDPFDVYLQDINERLVATLTTDSSQLRQFVMHATVPSNIIFAEVTNEPKNALEPTLIQMRVQTKHPLPPASAIELQVPSELLDSPYMRCSISSAPFDTQVCTWDSESHLFTISNINQFELYGSAVINIELAGFTNPAVASPTETFTIRTITSEGYLIDEKTSGLMVASSCDWPCWECAEGQPSECRKCDTRESSLLPLFFDGTCRDDCPIGFYEMNKICSQCDAGCLSCEESSKRCLRCHPGMYLLGNQCLDACPLTHHGVDETRTCELCTPPCETCQGSRTQCLSCDQTLPQYLFFENRCFEECPREISVFDQGRCVACSSNCRTCDYDYAFDHCTSCFSDQYLDRLTDTCVDMCPALVTVATFTASTPEVPQKQERTCELCHETCRKCDSKDTTICMECVDGLRLVETSKQCLGECPARTAEIWIPLTEDLVCAECAPGCAACQHARDHCTECDAGFVFYDHECLKACPEGFSVVSDELQVCVRDGEVCPYGQEYNKQGECDLVLAHCRVGYVLNAAKNECIPEPGFHLPFAFLYAAAGWLYFILRKKYRVHYKREELVSQALLGLTMLQQINYVCQLGLSFTMDFQVVTQLHVFGLVALYFLNIITVVAFLLLIKDKPFEHWRDQYERENRIVGAASLLFSFKMVRWLYSRFCGARFFDATCEDRFRSIVRPLFVLTMVGLIQVGPLVVADMYTIWLLRWGYEIVTLSYSSLVLAVSIFGLEVYEFILFKRQEPQFMGVGEYFSKDPNRPKTRKKPAYGAARKEIRVMSIMEDHGNDPMAGALGIPSEQDDNLGSSQFNVNESQKELLGGAAPGVSDQVELQVAKKGNSAQVRPFDFNNFKMGDEPPVNVERINFGEQGQAKILKGVIQKLNDHKKIKEIGVEIAAEEAKMMEAIEQELPDNGPFKDYLDEDTRKKFLLSSTKDKQKQFREKRQTFEKHRAEAETLRMQMESLPELITGQEQAVLARDYKQEVAERKKVLRPMLTQVDMKALRMRIEGRTFASDDESSRETVLSSRGRQRQKRNPPSRPISFKEEPINRRPINGKIPEVSYLEILQQCSEDELKRDKIEYDQFYARFKARFDEKARAGLLVPNAKAYESFDEDVLREMYDDFGVCSDFESELSWISYPPDRGFLCDYYENNPVKQAENELFKQKIKVKFQINNMYRESYDVPALQALNTKPSRKTQTLAEDIKESDAEFDPFESEEELEETESEQLSCVESYYYKGLVTQVIEEGFTSSDSEDYLDASIRPPSARKAQDSTDKPETVSEQETLEKAKKERSSKKRKRGDISTDMQVRQQLIKMEVQQDRAGLQGRGTQINQDLEGHLGDVFDTNGQLVYDKDYLSQKDTKSNKQISISEATVKVSQDLAANEDDYGKERSSQKSALLLPGKQANLDAKGSQLSARSKRSRRGSRRLRSSAGSQKSSARRSQGSRISQKSPPAQREPEANLQTFQVKEFAKPSIQQPSSHQFDTVAVERYSEAAAAVATGNMNSMNFHQPSGYDITHDFYLEEASSKLENSLTRRERQLIRTYAPIVETRDVLPEEDPKNSAQSQRRKSKSKKRKRQQMLEANSAFSPIVSPTGSQALKGAQMANRGLSDAQVTLEKEQMNPDNGILQLVINRDSEAIKKQHQTEIGAPMTVSQLKPEKPPTGFDASEYEGDQETRGGNMSSAQDQSSTNKLALGRSGTIGGDITTQHDVSGAKAHQFLNNQWESETSMSQNIYQFSSANLNGRRQYGAIGDSPPGKQIKTDDEQIVVRNFQNRAVTAGMHMQGTDFQGEQAENWSDGPGRQTQFGERNYSHGLAESAVPGSAFSRLGQSYVAGRTNGGPKPFMNLGVDQKPFKARKKRKQEQLLADQRRAKFTSGTDRMRNLENIYIKHGLVNTMAKTPGKNPQQSTMPRADSITMETVSAFKRHQKRGEYTGSAGYMRANKTTSKAIARRQKGPKLHKQNFVEDGQNIITGQLHQLLAGNFGQSSSTQKPLITHPDEPSTLQGHMQGPAQMTNSVSDSDFMLLNQLGKQGSRAGPDGTSILDSIEQLRDAAGVNGVQLPSAKDSSFNAVPGSSQVVIQRASSSQGAAAANAPDFTPSQQKHLVLGSQESKFDDFDEMISEEIKK